MSDFDERSAVSEWVAHEFRFQCRRQGWLTKASGIEFLFAKREEALKYIGSVNCGTHLMIRVWPDTLVRSERETFAVEAKTAVSKTESVSVELFQYCQFLMNAKLGVPVWYVFGVPGSKGMMQGYMKLAADLKPWRIDLPERFRREWAPDIQQGMQAGIAAVRKRFPSIAVAELDYTPPGSGHPYALIKKADIFDGLTVDDWILKGGGHWEHGKMENWHWEGKYEATAQWKSYPLDEWLKCSTRKFVRHL